MRGIIYFIFFLLVGISIALLSFPHIQKINKTSLSKSIKRSIGITLAPGAGDIKVFLVAPNDNGTLGKKIGCGDSVVAFSPPPHPIDTDQNKIETAYQELINIAPKTYEAGGLVNALENSILKLDSAEVVGGTAVVKLSGKVSLAGVCDGPRFKAQLEEAALQLPEVKNVKISINGQSLDSLLSGKGI